MLRGINLGPNRRVPMAELRALLTESGFEEVRTYVQSGNVVLRSALTPTKLEARARELISERFGFDVPVLARCADELRAVVEGDPLGDVAVEPKRYQVAFLSAPLSEEVARSLHDVVQQRERLVISGREAYAWTPEGVARSKLWNALAGGKLGVTVTARNWTTVTKLLAMASDETPRA
jgi:uncharacterized protein (DUF1697 family)